MLNPYLTISAIYIIQIMDSDFVHLVDFDVTVSSLVVFFWSNGLFSWNSRPTPNTADA